MVQRAAPFSLLVLLTLLADTSANEPLQRSGPARPSEAKANTSISEVANHRFGNGQPAGVGYKITYDVLNEIAPEEFLPSVRVDAAQHPEAFEGQWADDGFHAAWLSPLGKFQYFPNASTIESAYFDAYIVPDPDGTAIQAGDSFEIAVKQLAGDSPLTWSRQRGAATGELGWEVATRAQTVQGCYGDACGSMDVIFVRADLVVRGGDFDARDGERLPPLIIDLPKMYGPDVTGSASVAQFSPYLHYISNIEGAVLPQLGKAVITASTRGYLPESKEYTAPGGVHIREWHIPLHILIAILPVNVVLQPVAITTLRGGGVVSTFDGGLSKRLEVEPGGAVLFGRGLEPQLLRAAETANASPAAPVAGTGATLLDEIMAAAAIDHTITEPVPLVIGKRTYSLTVDPNLDGLGFLGLRDFEHVRTGQSFLTRTTIPFVKVNGETIALDRSRLLDLRVLPLTAYLTLGFTSRSDGDEVSYARARFGHIKRAGLKLDAVYGLGGDRYAFVSAFGMQEAPQDNGHAIDMSLQVWSLSEEAAEVSSVQYGEVGQPGPVTYGDQTMTHEFSGPNTAALRTSIAQIFGGASGGGQFTVVRAGGPLVPEPVANPSLSITGAPVGVYVTPPRPRNTTFYQSVFGSWLNKAAYTQTTIVGPIDQPCSTPQVVDDATADAAADLDIERAWFDFDGANLYTTIQVARLDQGTGSGPVTFRAGWRFEHVGYGVQAARDAAGNWTYELGLHSSAGAPWHSILSPINGELKFGTPGYIRMSHSIDVELSGTGFLPGEMLRDTGATSFNAAGAADRAPSGAPDAAYGRGGDFVIAPCRPPVELLGAASRKTHGPAGSFDLVLPLIGTPAVEPRDPGAMREYSIVFSFANPLTSVGGASVSRGTGNVSSSGIDPSDPHKYLVHLTGVDNAQLLSVSLTNVNDAAGNNSATISASVTVLAGDTNGDGRVNVGDTNMTKSHAGQVTNAGNFLSDANLDGRINVGDTNFVKANAGAAPSSVWRSSDRR